MRIAAVFALLAGSLAAQTARPTITPCSGGIGTKIDYHIQGGKPFLPYLMFFSVNRGAFPLSAIDPRDNRVLGFGLAPFFLLLIPQFDGKGETKFSLPLPNDPGFAGLSFVNQVLTFPGTTTTFGPMSEVSVVPFEVPGPWRHYKLNAMLQERAWVGWLPLGDERYLLTGGGRGALLALTAFKSTSIYDVVTRKFSPGPDMTQPRGLHRTAKLPDGKFILIGGVNDQNDPQSTCDIFDPKTGKFFKGPALNTKRTLHTATVLDDGRILVCGGIFDMNGGLAVFNKSLDTTEILDPKTMIWSLGPKMSEKKSAHTAHVLRDGRVAIVGGIIPGLILPGASNRTEIFDPKNNTITRVASMDLKVRRGGHAGGVLPDGRLIVSGGVGTLAALLNQAEVFNPTTGTWSQVASMSNRWGPFGSGIVLQDGRFLVAGGATIQLFPTADLIPVKNCEVYDPGKNSWKVVAGLNVPRAAQALLQLPSCAVVVIGGGSTAVIGNLKDHEIIYLPPK